MRITTVVLGLLTATISQSAFAQRNASVHVASGMEKRVDWIGTVARDCSVGQPPQVRPTNVAAHGQILVRDGTVTTNRVADCPELKVPAKIVFYKSSSGYEGLDRFDLEVDNGRTVTKKTYEITVGPADRAH